MPLVGVVKPNAREAIPHAGTKPEWVTPEALLEELAEANLLDSHWTFEMANAALSQVQSRGDMISTTALVTSCFRNEVIKRREDYVEDLNELYSRLRGTAGHGMLEFAQSSRAIAEVRFFTTIDGEEISGQPDLLTAEHLLDYKFPTDQNSIPMQNLFHNQTEQLMINAFICRHAERWDPEDAELAFDPRDELPEMVGIVFVGPKRPKVMVYKRQAEGIRGVNGKVMKRQPRLPYVWNDAEVLDTIRPRLHLLRRALESYPEWPEPWTNPDNNHTYDTDEVWGGESGDWTCPGPPVCYFQTCLAKRKPGSYVW